MSITTVASPNSVAAQVDRPRSKSKAAKLSRDKPDVDMSAHKDSSRSAKKRSADADTPDTPAKRRRSEPARDNEVDPQASSIGLGISGADEEATSAANQETESVLPRLFPCRFHCS